MQIDKEDMMNLNMNLDRIAKALETNPSADEIIQLRKCMEAGFTKLEQIICRYAEFVHEKTL